MLSIRSSKYQQIRLMGIDSIYTLCVALLPVLCLLNVPVANISLGTVLLLLFAPYAIIRILMALKGGRPRITAFFFFLFYLYLVFRADGSVSYMVLCAATFVHLWGIACGSVHTEKLRRYVELFALLNTALIFLQVLLYYGVHIKLTFLPASLFHRDFRESWVFRNEPGLYRPSALFLEPSHFAQYCCFALISVLFPREGKPNLIQAGFLALGCVLSTSGMGIAMVCAIIAWYCLVSRVKLESKLFYVVLFTPLVLIGLLVMLQIPFVQTALQRVFSNVDGYNAVRGRTGQWSRAIAPMSGADLWFGYGNSADYPYYLAGLADTIYKFGLVGALLEFACFLHLMFRKFDRYIWCCCLVFLALFCVAHLTSFYSQIFYLGLAAAEAVASKRRTTPPDPIGGTPFVKSDP